MTRRPTTATWWLLTDADGERYLRHVPRDQWEPMASAPCRWPITPQTSTRTRWSMGEVVATAGHLRAWRTAVNS